MSVVVRQYKLYRLGFLDKKVSKVIFVFIDNLLSTLTKYKTDTHTNFDYYMDKDGWAILEYYGSKIVTVRYAGVLHELEQFYGLDTEDTKELLKAAIYANLKLEVLTIGRNLEWTAMDIETEYKKKMYANR